MNQKLINKIQAEFDQLEKKLFEIKKLEADFESELRGVRQKLVEAIIDGEYDK